jgi:hypothetical protein
VPAFQTLTCGTQEAVCKLLVSDTANARDWSFQSNLQIGDYALGGDTYRFSAVPASFAGSLWIRPSRLSKTSTLNPLVTFTISAPADIYVAVDTRVTTPAWLGSWTDTGTALVYGGSVGPVTEKLLHKRFDAGSVPLGPIACPADASPCAMYFVLIRFVDPPVGGVGPACSM